MQLVSTDNMKRQYILQHTFLAIFSLVIACLLFSSCNSSKDLAYISDAQRDEAQTIVNNYHATIHPGDVLYIYVESQTPTAVIHLNQETNMIASEGQTSNIVPTGYLVDDKGDIIFPTLNKLHVADITQDSLSHLIRSRLIAENYVKDPTVHIQLMNFRVTVVGEVANPNLLHGDGTRMTILEALALAGDLTIYGRRDNISIIRQDGANQTIGTINLTSKTLFDSPYYYLQSNDIVFVESNGVKKRSATRNPEVPQYIAFATSAASSIVTTWRTLLEINRFKGR